MVFCKSSYLNLPDNFYSKELPEATENPTLIKINNSLVAELGLDVAYLESDEGLKILAGNEIPKNSIPVALAYAGHQFGHFNPQLGDGRAVLLAEIVDKNQQTFDVQLKGSGKTIYSRRGDGKSALGPVIREYVVSEAMHYLGIPTTRSLAIVKSGEFVVREQILPGGILTRIAKSHIRIGTFEYFAAKGDIDSVKILSDYSIKRHYKECLEAKNPYLEFLRCVINAQAKIICEWTRVGFIHGVMNTDNMTISGETIDYGPCAFLDDYDFHKAFSAIDVNKRYSFGNQAKIASWNLARFAECLLPILDEDINKSVKIAEEALDKFNEIYQKYWLDMMRKKLGLAEEREGDLALATDFLKIIQSCEQDYTQAFRYLSGDVNLEMNFLDNEDYLSFKNNLEDRLKSEKLSKEDRIKLMNSANPIYIPRNHLVEEIIKDVVENDNLTKLDEFLEILKTPYLQQECRYYYESPPAEIDENYQTFCGT